jgi:hypothetical protein
MVRETKVVRAQLDQGVMDLKVDIIKTRGVGGGGCLLDLVKLSRALGYGLQGMLTHKIITNIIACK